MSYYPGMYGTYPGKRAEYALMMQSQDADLQPLEGTPMRSILRNKNGAISRDLYDIYDPYGKNSSQTQLQHSKSNKNDKCQQILETVVRPCVAEFLSVMVAVIVYFHVESQFVQRHVTFFNKIICLSIVDTVVYTVFFSTFQTVQLSPTISIAQLFTLTTNWMLCLLLVFVQISGVLAGSALFYLLNMENSPSRPNIIQDLTSDWATGVLVMVIFQTIGTTMMVITNLLLTKKCNHKNYTWRRLNKSPLSVALATGLASLLSLLHSNISWNPLYVLVLLLWNLFYGNGFHLTSNDLLFWLGPLVGSLLGSIIFKLCTPHDKKVQNENNDG